MAMNETYFPAIFLNVPTHLHGVSTIDGEQYLRTNSDLTSDKTTASKIAIGVWLRKQDNKSEEFQCVTRDARVTQTDRN